MPKSADKAWQVPDAPMLCIQFWAPDDGWRNRLKHVEQFTAINKLRNVASFGHTWKCPASCFDIRLYRVVTKLYQLVRSSRHSRPLKMPISCSFNTREPNTKRRSLISQRNGVRSSTTVTGRYMTSRTAQLVDFVHRPVFQNYIAQQVCIFLYLLNHWTRE
jgi:hypothetical protein